MSDYRPLSGESENVVLPGQGLLPQGVGSGQGKRAARRQRGRGKKANGVQCPACLNVPRPLRGQRKIPDMPAPCREVDLAQAQDCQARDCFVPPAVSKPVLAGRHFVSPEAKLYAALDLGTNNCRLLIATPTSPGRFRTLERFSRIVRLGEGVGDRNCLNDEAMERTMEVLEICRVKLSQWPIHHQRLIATEACRQAVNGSRFLDRVRAQLGLDLEIVNRETEARLAVAGCSTLVEQETQALVLFDIGGGSSEIVLIDMSKRRSRRLVEHIIAWTSLPVGVVTLAERFGGGDVSTHDFIRMQAYVTSLINQFDGRDKLGDLVHCPSFHLLGTSGTMTTLAGIHLELERYDRRRIDGVWMRGEDVTRMTQRLLTWDAKQRRANPCIGPERSDLVLAGCAILEAIRAHWPSQRLRVADRGLREGILMELMSQNCAWRH